MENNIFENNFTDINDSYIDNNEYNYQNDNKNFNPNNRRRGNFKEFKSNKKNNKNNKNNKRPNRLKLIIVSLLVLAIIITIIFGIWYTISIKPVAKKDFEDIRITIGEKDTANSIIKELKEKKLIKNDFAFKILYKLEGSPIFQKGRYKISTSKSAKEIIKMFKSGDVNKDEIRMQFIEGKILEDYALVIEKATNNRISKDDVITLAKDKEYAKEQIKKYDFLTDEILDNSIRYPLEGYLFPDTYIFDKEVELKTIFDTMLKQTKKKLERVEELNKNKDNLKFNLTNHQIITLASIVELEGPKGSKRATIAEIFLNRLNKKMSLGSDVTTYYGINVKMSDRDLYQRELDAYNPYNTRGPNMEGKLPIGPVANPSTESINAVIDTLLNYTPSEYIFFVSDKNQKIYTAKTYSEHTQIINDLKAKGLWFTYNN